MKLRKWFDLCRSGLNSRIRIGESVNILTSTARGDNNVSWQSSQHQQQSIPWVSMWLHHRTWPLYSILVIPTMAGTNTNIIPLNVQNLFSHSQNVTVSPKQEWGRESCMIPDSPFSHNCERISVGKVMGKYRKIPLLCLLLVPNETGCRSYSLL